MSWGAIPGFIYDLEREHREAKMLCAFEEEVLSARTRSTPEHWYTLDQWRYVEPERKLVSLGVRVG
jgi:hypothetical protein